jgi:hypothetical protein
MFFPRIVLGFWVAVAVLDMVAELRDRKAVTQPRLLRVTLIAVASLAFLLSITRVGFFLAAVPFALVALVTLGVRNPVSVAGVAIGVPAALVALFNHILTLPLPTSPFVWWF